MKNLPLITLVGILGLFLGGCPSGNNTDQSQQITQEPPPSPSPSPVVSPVQPPTFEEATQPGTSPKQPTVAGLIPSTDPNQQRSTIDRGRSDPFVPFPVTPTVTIKQTEDTSTGTQSVPNNPGSKTGTSPTTVTSSGTQPSGTQPRGSQPNSSTPKVTKKVPPPPPEPTEARNVVVSGIVQLSENSVAIVQAPGESTERRVVPGSTLSNGQVLVKAISANPDNPYIVLEQYGQEVTRRLGEGLPPPPPENTQALLRLN